MKRISYETAKLAFEKGYLEYDETFYNKHGNLVTEHNYSLGIIPDFDCSAPLSSRITTVAERRTWNSCISNIRRDSIILLDYILNLQSKVAQEIWCGQYEDCLESGLQAALKML